MMVSVSGHSTPAEVTCSLYKGQKEEEVVRRCRVGCVRQAWRGGSGKHDEVELGGKGWGGSLLTTPKLPPKHFQDSPSVQEFLPES